MSSDAHLVNTTNSTTICGAAEEEDTPAFLLILGILLGLSASIGINLGNNMQSLGMAIQARTGQAKKNKTFWIGTTMFAVASIVNFAAFGFAPASTLAPLESVQFVTNLLFARFVRHKTVTPKMVIGSSLIVGGTVVAIVVAPSGVAKFCIHDLTEFWVAPGWIWYLVIVATLAAALLITHEIYQKALLTGKKLRGYRLVLPVTYAVSSALAGSQCVVQAKTMSELFELIVTGDWSTIAHWFFWFNLVLLMIFLVTWLYRMNMALKKYDPMFIIPLLQSNYILFSTVTGGIYFQEFALMSDSDFPWFFSGIAIMFFGLGLLAPTSGSDDELEESSKAGEQNKNDWESSNVKEESSHTDQRCTYSENVPTMKEAEGQEPVSCSPQYSSSQGAREMDVAEAEDFFSDVLGPGPLTSPRDQGVLQSTADLALSMGLHTPVKNDRGGGGTEDPDTLTGDNVQVTVGPLVLPSAEQPGSSQSAPWPRMSGESPLRCNCAALQSFTRAESDIPVMSRTIGVVSSEPRAASEWPLVSRDNSARERVSGTHRPSAATSTGSASRVSSAPRLSSFQRPSVGRQSQRMRQTSNAMPEPAVFGFLDLFGGQQTFVHTVREGSLTRERTGSSNPNLGRMYSTAPATGSHVSGTRPSLSPCGIALKPEAIELAKRMDNI